MNGTPHVEVDGKPSLKALADHLKRFNQLIYRLKVSGTTYSDTDRAREFLISIGIVYRPVGLAFKRLMSTQRTWLALVKLWNTEISALCAEEQRLMYISQQEAPEPMALSVKARMLKHSALSKGKGKALRDMSKLKCYNCQELGHFVNKCPHPREDGGDGWNSRSGNGGQNRQRNPQKTDTGGQAMVSEGLFFMATEDIPARALSMTLSSSWIFDSGATHHLTNAREALVISRQLSQPLTFNLANNSTIKAFEVGDVHIKVEGLDIAIKDVYLIPESRVSLLSVGRMMEKGWVVQMMAS